MTTAKNEILFDLQDENCYLNVMLYIYIYIYIYIHIILYIYLI